MFEHAGAKALSRVESQPRTCRSVDIADLLARYPHLNDEDIGRAIESYRGLSALEVALIISDEKLGPKLTRFRNDHRSALRTPFREYAVLVAIALAGFAVIGWALAVGS